MIRTLYTADTAMKYVYLEDDVRARAERFIEQFRAAGELRNSGYDPEHRVIINGLPGNGRTMLAKALAHECGLHVMTINCKMLVLGAESINGVLETTTEEPCAVIFEHYSVLRHQTGKTAAIALQTQELIRNILSFNLVIATCHMPLDRIRHFDVLLTTPNPRGDQMRKMVSRSLEYHSGWDKDSQAVQDLTDDIMKLEIPTFHQMRKFLMRMQRTKILHPEIRYVEIIDDMIEDDKKLNAV